MKRLFAFLLAFSFLLLTMTSCGKDKTKTENNGNGDYVSAAESSDLVIPYSREDGINPYKATSLMNQCVMPLLYQSLYTLTASYEATPTLASKAVFSGKKLTLTLNNNTAFSDGTFLNASDVVYSFNLAKASAYYGTGLSQFSSIRADSGNTVTLTMTDVNLYATALLTFPIVKSGTATDNTSIPVGSGPYTYSKAESGGLLSLKKGESGKAKQVYLLNVTDSGSLLSSLAIGNVDLVFDDISDGTLTRVDNAKKVQADLNQLLYIGINERISGLSDPEVRLSLSAVLNRTDLISTGVDGYGTPATLPFNPKFYALEGLKVTEKNKAEAGKLLEETFRGETLTILTDADNAFKVKTANALAQQLAAAGINTKVEALSYEAYAAAVTSGDYELYVGEIKLTGDMNISTLLSGELLDTYQYLLTGDIKVSDFAEAFRAEEPFVPIGFRNGVVCCSQDMTTEFTTLPGNPFAGVQNAAKRSG